MTAQKCLVKDLKTIISVPDIWKVESTRAKAIPEGHLYALSKVDGKLLELLVGESDVLIKGLSQNGIN